VLACVANFAGVPHHDYRLGLPCPGTWREAINTDAEAYGGSGVGNYGAVEAVPGEYHGLPASAALSLPPLGVLWLTAEPPTPVPDDHGARRPPADRPELRSTSPVETGQADAVSRPPTRPGAGPE
jgi:1,4-alpha-glucan branching enzyme